VNVPDELCPAPLQLSSPVLNLPQLGLKTRRMPVAAARGAAVIMPISAARGASELLPQAEDVSLKMLQLHAGPLQLLQENKEQNFYKFRSDVEVHFWKLQLPNNLFLLLKVTNNKHVFKHNV
jgi:hypothetical protein